MIELTVMAAKEIDNPHETYLLDDGYREELRQVALPHTWSPLPDTTDQPGSQGGQYELWPGVWLNA